VNPVGSVAPVTEVTKLTIKLAARLRRFMGS